MPSSRGFGSPPPLRLSSPPSATRSGGIKSPWTGTSSPTPLASSPGLHTPAQRPQPRPPRAHPSARGRRRRKETRSRNKHVELLQPTVIQKTN
ncbi:hypothetical protein U9M48_013597 [Paspalum notatum var. saurae]|uniref:Uncharacterized protein n=1 Tax=Paspalum notatum var. saurae TaxID=547442 RepID=A0AAQ3WJL4_PASNO